MPSRRWRKRPREPKPLRKCANGVIVACVLLLDVALQQIRALSGDVSAEIISRIDRRRYPFVAYSIFLFQFRPKPRLMTHCWNCVGHSEAGGLSLAVHPKPSPVLA